MRVWWKLHLQLSNIGPASFKVCSGDGTGAGVDRHAPSPLWKNDDIEHMFLVVSLSHFLDSCATSMQADWSFIVLSLAGDTLAGTSRENGSKQFKSSLGSQKFTEHPPVSEKVSGWHSAAGDNLGKGISRETQVAHVLIIKKKKSTNTEGMLLIFRSKTPLPCLLILTTSVQCH